MSPHLIRQTPVVQVPCPGCRDDKAPMSGNLVFYPFHVATDAQLPTGQTPIRGEAICAFCRRRYPITLQPKFPTDQGDTRQIAAMHAALQTSLAAMNAINQLYSVEVGNPLPPTDASIGGE